MDRYAARMNLNGETHRDKIKERTIRNLKRKACKSLSCKDVLINGVESKLIINSGTQKYYKEFETLPGKDINIGDYVQWANSYWIVETCNSDNEIYKDGKMNQCNYLLKWQNDNGDIIERWSFIQSASKYNDGTDGNNIITIGSDQLSVMIPVDEESLSLNKKDGIKFFIDNNKIKPTVYELTGTGNVINTFNCHGVTSWIVKECVYSPTENDLIFGVCNYKSKDEISQLIKSENQTLPPVTIEGNMEIKTGFERTYTAHIKNCDNYEITWKVESDYNIIQKIVNNKIKLYIDDKNAIGDSIKLKCLINNIVVADANIIVVAGF